MSTAHGLTISGPMTPAYAEILTDEALGFVATLARAFEPRRQELLLRRQERWALLKAGPVSYTHLTLPTNREV